MTKYYLGTEAGFEPRSSDCQSLAINITWQQVLLVPALSSGAECDHGLELTKASSFALRSLNYCSLLAQLLNHKSSKPERALGHFFMYLNSTENPMLSFFL